MTIRNITIAVKGKEASFSNEDTKETVLSKLGEPDDTGATSRKHPDPRIFKYDELEFHFDYDNKLVLIYREDDHGTPETAVSFDDA